MRTRRERTLLRLATELGLASLLASGAGCEKDTSSHERGSTVTKPPIAKVIETHSAALMAEPGVVGVYEGARDDGSPCIRVMVVRKTSDLEKRLPGEIEGWPVEIEVTGEIRPMGGE